MAPSKKRRASIMALTKAREVRDLIRTEKWKAMVAANAGLSAKNQKLNEELINAMQQVTLLQNKVTVLGHENHVMKSVAANDSLSAENQKLNEELTNAMQQITLLQNQVTVLGHENHVMKSSLGHKLLQDAEQKAMNAALELNDFKVRYHEMLNEAIDARMKCTLYQHAQEKAHLRRMIDSMRSQMATLGNFKSYDKLGSRSGKNSRCTALIKVIEQFVGEINVDDFLTHFMHFVSERPSFSFKIGLTALDSYLMCSRWRISPDVLRGIGKFLKKKLGYEVISHHVPEMRNRYSTKTFYDISLDIGTKNKTVVAELSELKTVLVQRLGLMENYRRLQVAPDEELFIRYLHGKGDEMTVLVAMIENSFQSWKGHGFLLLGYYTGDDDEETLDEKLGRVRKQALALDSLTYNGTTRTVQREFGRLQDNHLEDFLAVFDSVKINNPAALRDPVLKAASICQQMYNLNIMFDSGNFENLCE